MLRRHCRTLRGYHIIFFLTHAVASSFSNKCWPSVHLHNATSTSTEAVRRHDESVETVVETHAAFSIRGLPCTRNDQCCSANLVVGQGATTCSPACRLHTAQKSETMLRSAITLSPVLYPAFSSLVVNESVVIDSAPQYTVEIYDALQASMRNS